MAYRRPLARAQTLLAHAFNAYATAVNRSLISGEQWLYPASLAEHTSSRAHACDHSTAPLPVHEQEDTRHAFDFLQGDWQVRNARLKDPLHACEQWDIFQTRQRFTRILGGSGYVCERLTDAPDAGSEVVLHLYDRALGQWHLHHASTGHAWPQPPLAGGFENGIGLFHGRQRHQGRNLWVRLRWHDITADSAHCEQAFSPDRGGYWQTHWHMYLTRVMA